MRETIGSGANAQVLDFIYDASGRPFALKYTNGAADPVTYYYALNLQGDVVGLTDADGACIVKYRYNAWGQPIAVTDADDVAITDTAHIAHVNPLRYRGYYYDTETGFYYLQTRYYDPTMHRFINADSFASTGQGFIGTNMFVYGFNRLVICADSSGSRTYFINGIHNENDEEAPSYAEDFANELNNVSGETVVVVPVYCGQSKWYHYIIGVAQVAFEMLNIDVYTSDVIDYIMNDLEANPLAEGEKITLIGYSGGGQLALNVMEKIDIPVDNVILIGAPFSEMWKTKTKISILYSNDDPLSWIVGFGYDSYNVGNIGHTEYFDSENIGKIAEFVTFLIK